MPTSRALFPWLAVLGFVAGTAIAQETTNRLEVYLSNCDGSEDSRDFELIALEGQSQPLRGTWTHTVKCTWLFTSQTTFSTDVRFSLIVNNVARTKCRASRWDDDKHYATVELRLFRGVLRILLRRDDFGAIDYKRRLPGKEERERPGKDDDLECSQNGALTGGSNQFTLANAQTEVESIRLPKFLNPKDRCGIFVNLLPPVQNARKKRSIGNIGDEDVAFVYVRQANAGQNCHPPVQSGALFDVIEENGKHHTIHVEAN